MPKKNVFQTCLTWFSGSMSFVRCIPRAERTARKYSTSLHSFIRNSAVFIWGQSQECCKIKKRSKYQKLFMYYVLLENKAIK